MRKKKILLIAIELLLFSILHIFSTTLLKEVYIFEWIVHNKNFYIWIPIIAIVLLLFDKNIISISLTIGNILGLFVGQLWGDFIRNENMKQITIDMNAEQTYRLQKHYGFFIWILLLLGILIISSIVQMVINKRTCK